MNTRFRESIGEIVGGSVLCVLGIVWAVVSSDYGVFGEGGRLAPGTLPFFCGVGLAITGGVIAIKAAFVGRGSSDDSDATAGEANEGVGAAQAAPAAPAAPMDTATFAHVTAGRSPRPIGSLPKRYPIATVYVLVVLLFFPLPLQGTRWHSS